MVSEVAGVRINGRILVHTKIGSAHSTLKAMVIYGTR